MISNTVPRDRNDSPLDAALFCISSKFVDLNKEGDRSLISETGSILLLLKTGLMYTGPSPGNDIFCTPEEKFILILSGLFSFFLSNFSNFLASESLPLKIRDMTKAVAKPYEFKNVNEFLKQEAVPRIMLYASKDSYEFDQLTDRYREVLEKTGQTYETIVYVSEPGDTDRFYTELFNFSMFASAKLFVIKSANQFFKSIQTMKKEQLESLKKSLENIPDNYLVIAHFDGGDIPSKTLSLFGDNAGVLKAKNYYPGETRAALEEILKENKVTLDADAFEEFIYKTHPSHGAYLKSVRKLQLYLNKKHFTLEDIHNVLSNNTELNAAQLVDLIFINHEYEFFKELSKFRPEADNLLLFLTILLNRTNELRKYKVISRQKHFNEDTLFQMLGMESWSEKRKRFVLSRMQRESRIFNDRVLDTLYDILVDISIRSKLSAGKNEILVYFMMRMTELFSLIKKGS